MKYILIIVAEIALFAICMDFTEKWTSKILWIALLGVEISSTIAYACVFK